MTDTDDATPPYPGLRPFTAQQAHLFFGREEQTDELVRRLRLRRLLAVTGTSGSGKSSLVQAGLLPRLHGGQMAQTGSAWRIATMRPGADPIGNLTRALNAADVFGDGAVDGSLGPGLFTETTLRRGPLGLIEVAVQNRLAADENLLVLVDQFEEMFRFARVAVASPTDDRAAFVKLLLEASRHTTPKTFIVLTMRSDFVGDCARYRGLPEAINEGRYLVPRMTRDQLRQAIIGPAAVGRTDVTPRLVQRLLADVGDDPDQLPLLQHALMRTWNIWAASDRKGPLDLEHYEQTGGLATALSNHADEAYAMLAMRSRGVCRRLFQRLTERSEDFREARVPARVKDICDVAEAATAEVIEVIEVFRRPDRSFLTSATGALDEQSTVEISHESLMRVWTRLKGWVTEEADAAGRYQRLAQTAALYEQGEAPLLTDPELSRTLDWVRRWRPNAAWASRYNSAFDRAVAFLQRSREARDAALFSYAEIALYLGAFVLMCGGLFYFGAEVAYPDSKWGWAWAFLWLAIPFIGLNLAGHYQAQRSREALSVTFYVGGLVLLPLFLLILIHEKAWLERLSYQWPSLFALIAPFAALGAIATSGVVTKKWERSSIVAICAVVLSPLLALLIYHARHPGETPRQLLDGYNNAQFQVALLIACGWAVWLALRTHTVALSAAFAVATILVAAVTLANVGLMSWLEDKEWHLIALNLLPLVPAFAGLGFALHRSGRPWFGTPLYASAAALLVVVLELLAQNGKEFQYLHVSLARFGGDTRDGQVLLDTLASMSLNGALFCLTAWILSRRSGELVGAAARLLFVLAPFAMLEPLAYISGTKQYSVTFDWIYLTLALLTAILTHQLRRRSFYYAGLVNSGAALWFIADRKGWLDDHRWAVTLILVGLAGLAIGYRLEQRRQRHGALTVPVNNRGAEPAPAPVKAAISRWTLV